MSFSHFMRFTTFLETFFFEKNNYFSFNVFFVLFYAGNIESALDLLVKWEVVSPNSRWGQWESLSPAGAVGPGTGYIATPPVRMYVRPSITLSFRTVTRKRIDVFFTKLCRYVHHPMRVCCIVFDIDGILFEFFKYWKKKKSKIFFLQYFMFSSRFMLFPTFKKYWCKKKLPGGGGGGVGKFSFFLWKNNAFSFHFAFYAIFNIKKYCEKCPFTYWLNGEVISPSSRWGQW